MCCVKRPGFRPDRLPVCYFTHFSHVFPNARTLQISLSKRVTRKACLAAKPRRSPLLVHLSVATCITESSRACGQAALQSATRLLVYRSSNHPLLLTLAAYTCHALPVSRRETWCAGMPPADCYSSTCLPRATRIPRDRLPCSQAGRKQEHNLVW